jgi:2-polyprenyl-3-methyl-5-hydroxy-6-metoxy-1,4-benzoquinol methylase
MSTVITAQQANATDVARTTGACPLCGSDHGRTLQTIRSDAICALLENTQSLGLAEEFGDCSQLELRHCANCDLRFFHPAVTGSERFYQQLQVLESYYQEEKPEFAFARSQLRPEHKVLEIGCGTGAFGASLRSASYVGLEFSEQAALDARRRGLEVLRESIEEHAQKHAAQYDAVCALQVLEHVARPDQFLRAGFAALKPRGLMILSVPSVDSFASGLPDFLLDMPPHHVTRWSDRCLQKVADLFSGEVVSLWHEPLQPAHRRMHGQSAILRRLYALSGRAVPVVNETSGERAAARIAWKLSALLAPVLQPFARRGISVTAVYRKPA